MVKKITAGALSLCLVVTFFASCNAEEKPLKIALDNSISTYTEEQGKSTLKVISYNVKDCEDGEKIAEIADDIKAKDADVVCVQEIDNMTKRSGKRDVLDLLARELGMNYCFYPSIKLQGGLYGIGILSKYELENCERTSLEAGREEGRVLAQAQVTVGGKVLNIFNTHLSYESEKLRSGQMEFLNEKLTSKTPFVLTGDFNIESFDDYKPLQNVSMVNREDNQLNSFIGNDGTAFTALDNIICSNGLNFLTSEMGKTSVSDHNFLYGEIAF